MDMIQSYLQALADQNNGTLTPDLVLESARDPTSPIHSSFTWADDVAAHKHRLDEARALIRAVKVEVRTERLVFEIPAFVRDPSVGSGQGYIGIGKLRTDSDNAREVVLREMQRASAALSRARGIAAVLGLGDQIEEIEGRIVNLIGAASQVTA